jgi:hypothetical protein
MKKIPIYARERVAHLWIVDPNSRTIEALYLQGQRYELLGTWGGDDEPFAIPPFETVNYKPTDFWGRPAPR